MGRLRHSALRWITVAKGLTSIDRRRIKIQLTVTVVSFCTLLLLAQLKPVINEKLGQVYQLIGALEKTGSPGGAKALPCDSHPGKNCAPGVFGSSIAQMHGCCGSFSSVSNRSDSDP